MFIKDQANYFQTIISPQNSKIKELKKLALKKYRSENNEFTVENFTIIRDALTGGYDFESLFVTKHFLFKNREKIDSLHKQSKCKDYFLIDERINKSYSQLDTPSGITAMYKTSNTKFNQGSAVYLDSISDPGNLGTILRSALAFGFMNIVLNKDCVDIYNTKTINAARDAIFKLNLIEDRDGAWLSNSTYPIYTTSSHDGRELSKFKPAKVFTLILSHESHGTSPNVISRATESIKIEMSSKIESLNVASAAAIIFYEFRRI